MIHTIKILKDWGVAGGLVIALFWMNSRIENVEYRLYDCYEKRVMHVTKDQTPDGRLFAILPKKLEITERRTRKLTTLH